MNNKPLRDLLGQSLWRPYLGRAPIPVWTPLRGLLWDSLNNLLRRSLHSSLHNSLHGSLQDSLEISLDNSPSLQSILNSLMIITWSQK